MQSTEQICWADRGDAFGAALVTEAEEERIMLSRVRVPPTLYVHFY